MKNLLYLAVSIFIFQSCGMTDHTFNNEDLVGEWTLVKATRDGVETETLSGLFFNFLNDTEVVTNFSGIDEEQISYSRSGNKLIFDGNENIAVKVIAIAQDSLTISTTIKEMEFKMWLVTGKN